MRGDVLAQPKAGHKDRVGLSPNLKNAVFPLIPTLEGETTFKVHVLMMYNTIKPNL